MSRLIDLMVVLAITESILAGSSRLQQFAHAPNVIADARWPGILTIGTSEIPCYVLDDGRRVITRTAATAELTDDKGGGQLEKYVTVENLRGFVPAGFKDQMIDFFIPGVSVPNSTTKGISAENVVEICQAYVAAFQADALTTERQRKSLSNLPCS